MTFRIKTGRGFGDEGMVFTAPIIEKKFNGYKVLNFEGDDIAFLCFTDIDILELSEEEKQMKVTL